MPSKLKLHFLPQDGHYWRIDWFGNVAYRSQSIRTSTPSIRVSLSQWKDGNLDAERIKNVSGTNQKQAHIPVGFLGKVRVGDVWRNGELVTSPPYQIEVFTDVLITRGTTDIIKAGLSTKLAGSEIFYLPLNVHPYHSAHTGAYCVMVELPGEKRLIVPAIELVRFYFGSSSNLINALFRVPLTQDKLWLESQNGYGRHKSKIILAAGMFSVSRSGFYAWLKQKPSRRAQENERLKVAIKAAHKRTRESYSARRLQAELAADGFTAGRDRIARLRRELGLRCRQKRKFKATTNSNHNLPVAENLLNQAFTANAPNEIWVTDITYIPTGEGWLYLAGVKDVFTCEIVGYAMAERMTQDLTGRALFRAVQQKRPAVGLIHHSDRGSQYCSNDYRNLLEQFGMRASMSRRGNCYDNAPMESFWGSLKNELVHHCRYATRTEAEASIREYIEIFYNRQRRHSRLGYIAPAVYAQNFNRQTVSA